MRASALRSWIEYGAIAATVVGAAVTVARVGGSRDPRPAVPSPIVGDDAKAPSVTREASVAYQVTTRFIDALYNARADVPALRASQPLFSFHTRKMPVPWATYGGDASHPSHLAFTIALRSGPADAPAGGEGSFDQREAIFAPAPSTIAFRTSIPSDARFTFSPATLNVSTDAVMFEVIVVDAKNAEHTVYAHRVPPSEMRTWLDASVDLGVYSGQDVELRLKTSLSPATPAEHASEKKPNRHVRPPNAEGGAGNAPAAPKENPYDRALGSNGAIPLAVWGNPTMLAKGATTLPYNVLWIVVDALRSDAIAKLHDDESDAASAHAARPPLEALLPKMDGLTPALDALAARSLRFTHAHSAATWMRPSILSMLGGARASELGIDPFHAPLNASEVARFYAEAPPLLPLIFRKNGAIVRAFVNDDALLGTIPAFAPNGVDLGFDRVDDRRDRARDTAEITSHAIQWLKSNRDERFFLFCHYAAPREPLDPPSPSVARVPPPPLGPGDETTRLYLGEIAKDDDAIGTLLNAVNDLGLRDDTIVVLTSDYGETLSSAHDAKSPVDHLPMRFHHASGYFEETTRVPILIAIPGDKTPRAVNERVRTTDLAPTLLDLEGIDASARTKMSGRSLLPLGRGEKEDDPRVIVTEGRGFRAILSGKYRLIVFDAAPSTPDVLYDLDDDPGERHDLAGEKADIVAEMHARLDAAIKNVPMAGSKASLAAPSTESEPLVHFRFVGAGRSRRIAGTITALGKTPPTLAVIPIALSTEALTVDGSKLTIAFTTAPDGPVGFDLRITPNASPLHWELTLDDDPFPDQDVFVGPFGLISPLVHSGIATDEARATLGAGSLPFIDPQTDLGLFLTRDRPAK